MFFHLCWCWQARTDFDRSQWNEVTCAKKVARTEQRSDIFWQILESSLSPQLEAEDLSQRNRKWFVQSLPQASKKEDFN